MNIIHFYASCFHHTYIKITISNDRRRIIYDMIKYDSQIIGDVEYVRPSVLEGLVFILDFE